MTVYTAEFYGEKMANRADYQDREMWQYAAKMRDENNQVSEATVAANKEYADEKTAINARFVELRIAGMDSDDAGNLIREEMGRPNMIIDAEEDASCDTLEELKLMWT